jgi:peptidoglycan/LPS O-acetylase OafA/YrhL
MDTDVRRLGAVPALDAVRGVAIVAVVLSHLWIVMPTWWGIGAVDDILGMNGSMARAGFVGVDLFFVLSGFLITALLLQEQHDRGRVGLAAFYARRALRLLPALWLLLAVQTMYAVGAGYPNGRTEHWGSLTAALLYRLNWRMTTDQVGDLGALWSLAIEGQFYLVWPLAVIAFFGLQRRLSRVVLVLAAAIVLVAVRRAMVFDELGWVDAFVRSDTRIDGLLVGALAAMLWVRGALPRRLPPVTPWLAGAVMIAVFAYIDAARAFVYRGGLTVFVAAAAVLVVWVASTPDRRPSPGFFQRLAESLGRRSYGLYLWHFPVFWAFSRRAPEWPHHVVLLAALTVTAVGTYLSWVLVEVPALRHKDRIAARRRSDLGPRRGDDQPSGCEVNPLSGDRTGRSS